jgi:hypothetical protein
MTKAKKPKLKQWRVEASVPAIQHVEASSKEEATELACANSGGWEVDLNAPICAEHVIDVEAEDEDE